MRNKIKNMLTTLMSLTGLEKDKVKKGHLAPDYYGYDDGFAKTNKCDKCGLIGLYEDLHVVDCCNRCGGNISRYGVGEFVKGIDGEYSWVKPVDYEG